MKKLLLIALFMCLPSLAHAATYYWCTTPGTTNWSTGSNWTSVLADQGTCAASGTAPTASDTAIINSSSGNIALDSTTADLAGTLTMTGYTGTLTLTTNDILIVSGSVTLGGTITGTGTLKINGVSTITTNSISWPGALNLAEAGAVTIANGGALWSITGLCTNSAATNLTPNAAGDGLSCAGGLTLSASQSASSTAPITISGGTWSGNNVVWSPLTINGNVIVSGSLQYSGSSLTYSSGTVTTTGSSLSLSLSTSGAMTLNTSGITWNNLSIAESTSSTGTYTLGSNLNVGGTLSLGSSSASGVTSIVNIVGAYNISCNTLQYSSSPTTQTFKIPAGQTITVTSAIKLINVLNSTYSLQSGTSNSPFYLVYQGSLANEVVVGGIFTDVQVLQAPPIPGYGQVLANFNGGTLTRTAGIQNFTAVNFNRRKSTYAGI